jgi:hypothetical protein
MLVKVQIPSCSVRQTGIFQSLFPVILDPSWFVADSKSQKRREYISMVFPLCVIKNVYSVYFILFNLSFDSFLSPYEMLSTSAMLLVLLLLLVSNLEVQQLLHDGSTEDSVFVSVTTQ